MAVSARGRGKNAGPFRQQEFLDADIAGQPVQTHHHFVFHRLVGPQDHGQLFRGAGSLLQTAAQFGLQFRLLHRPVFKKTLPAKIDRDHDGGIVCPRQFVAVGKLHLKKPAHLFDQLGIRARFDLKTKRLIPRRVLQIIGTELLQLRRLVGFPREDDFTVAGDGDGIGVGRAGALELDQHTRRIKQRAEQHEDDEQKEHSHRRAGVQRPPKNGRLTGKSHVERAATTSGAAVTMFKISLETCSMSSTIVLTLPTR